MAKPNPLLLKIVFLGLPLILGVALLPTDSPKSSTQPSNAFVKPSPDRGGSGSNLPQYDSSEVHDKFRSSDSLPGAIPSGLANGNTGWFFTGTVTVNGVQKAVLENERTGDAAYLATGEAWYQLRVMAIHGNSIIIADDQGGNHTIVLGGASGNPYGLSGPAPTSKAETPTL